MNASSPSLQTPTLVQNAREQDARAILKTMKYVRFNTLPAMLNKVGEGLYKTMYLTVPHRSDSRGILYDQ
jgi:hypothetical protein